MEILPYVHVQRIVFAKKVFKCKRYSVQCFHFCKRKADWFWRKYFKRKLFSGIISYGAPNEPEAYLESSRTFAMEIFFAKIVNDYKPLTIFAKKLSHRCSAGFQIYLRNLHFTFFRRTQFIEGWCNSLRYSRAKMLTFIMRVKD